MKRSPSKKVTGGIDLTRLKESINKVSQEHWLTSAALSMQHSAPKKESPSKRPKK